MAVAGTAGLIYAPFRLKVQRVFDGRNNFDYYFGNAQSGSDDEVILFDSRGFEGENDMFGSRRVVETERAISPAPELSRRKNKIDFQRRFLIILRQNSLQIPKSKISLQISIFLHSKFKTFRFRSPPWRVVSPEEQERAQRSHSHVGRWEGSRKTVFKIILRTQKYNKIR